MIPGHGDNPKKLIIVRRRRRRSSRGGIGEMIVMLVVLGSIVVQAAKAKATTRTSLLESSTPPPSCSFGYRQLQHNPPEQRSRRRIVDDDDDDDDEEEVRQQRSGSTAIVSELRGGGGGESKKKTATKKKKSRNKSKSSKKKKTKTKKATSTEERGEEEEESSTKTKTATKEDQREINKVLHDNRDSAQALGDAIRDRADEWYFSTSASKIDTSIQSLGWALGASDQRLAEQQLREQQRNALAESIERDYDNDNIDHDHYEEQGGSVEIASSSVIAHYFLKSHGGAHALQSLCSVLASIAGLGAVGFATATTNNNNKSLILSLNLMKRCCLFAMVKHVSGLFAGSMIAARAIPEIGLRQARKWMEQLAQDPISQYLFYTACIIVWLPPTPTMKTTTAAEATAATTSPAIEIWWQNFPLITLILVGPVILREFISTCLVISDVLVLLACSSNNDSNKIAKRMLSVLSGITNAFMCVLVTPSVWNNSKNNSDNPSHRQAVLAKLTSRISLVMEVAVGCIMSFDAMLALIELFFGGGQSSSSSKKQLVFQTTKRFVCTKLYLQFLLTRRKRIRKLATKLRGGATQLPFYVLGVLLDPMASMGLADTTSTSKSNNSSNNKNSPAGSDTLNRGSTMGQWRDNFKLVLGLDDDN